MVPEPSDIGCGSDGYNSYGSGDVYPPAETARDRPGGGELVPRPHLLTARRRQPGSRRPGYEIQFPEARTSPV